MCFPVTESSDTVCALILFNNASRMKAIFTTFLRNSAVRQATNLACAVTGVCMKGDRSVMESDLTCVVVAVRCEETSSQGINSAPLGNGEMCRN